jgi:hypothetical protein
MKNIFKIISFVEVVQLSYNATDLEHVGPGVYLASNRNEYQKYKNNNVSEE